jgi:hypothetical protein
MLAELKKSSKTSYFSGAKSPFPGKCPKFLQIAEILYGIGSFDREQTAS